jgi:hypothetical protein
LDWEEVQSRDNLLSLYPFWNKMLQKSTLGRSAVALPVIVMVLGSAYILFSNLGQSLYGDPSAISPREYCLETAIYLWDSLERDIAHQASTTGVFTAPTRTPTAGVDEHLQEVFTQAKARCLGHSESDPTVERLYDALGKKKAAYQAWRQVADGLREGFVRDYRASLVEFTLR